MAKAQSCIFVPEVNGEASKLYTDLSKTIKSNRQLVNYLYALYLQPGVAAAIDNQLMTNGQQTPRHNAQGQHYVEDVLAFFQFNVIQNQLGSRSVEQGRLRQQITDPSNALEVMQLADAFNDSHKGLVAYVHKNGNTYDVYVKQRDSQTQSNINFLKEQLATWHVYESAFQRVGVDFNNVSNSIKNEINPYKMNLVDYFISLQNVSHRNLYRKDALVLLELGCTPAQKQVLQNVFGSIEAAADAVDSINHAGIAASGLSNHQVSRLRNALNQAQQFFGIDLQDLRIQISHVTQQSQQSNAEYGITQTLKQLQRQYNIDGAEETLTSRNITKLSQAASNAIMITERRLRDLQRENGFTPDVKRLMDLQKRLFSELRSRRYYRGVVEFLQEVSPIIMDIENMIQNTPQTGTPLENAFTMAKTLEAIRIIYDEYHPVLDALVNQGLELDEAITQNDLDALRDVARNLNETLNNKYMLTKNMGQDTMIQLMYNVIGDKTADGNVIASIIDMPNKDVTFWDNNFYSMARCSNLIVAAAGDITQRAQVARNERLNEIALRIRRATDNLYKSGTKNTEFMYEMDGMGHWVIISDIDWLTYQQARGREKARLSQQNLDAYEYNKKLQDWDEANTEERAVDTDASGRVIRTERVPNSNYRKTNPYDRLSTAEKKYYDEMMQIKGEMGTLIPEIAQHHYRPPQLRRNMVDAMSKARNAKDVIDALKKKAERFSKIMEDDTDFYENGTLINGDTYTVVRSNEKGELKKYIPIFFVNQIDKESQGELLKDFSAGIQAFAATAINYDCMNQVLDVVNFMRNYVDANMETATDNNQVDIVSDTKSQVKEVIRKATNDNVVDLLNAFINQHFYGQNLDPNQPLYKYAKQVKSLIGYTSFKGLSSNWLGATANFLVAEFQMLIEAGAGEFYNYKDYAWANAALFGKNGVGGDIAELLTNNMTHKAPLLAQMFDPLQENFSDKMHTRYHHSLFRKILSHDCSMIGYGAGEHFVHYVNMYAILHHHKVLVPDGQGGTKETTLYHAFEVVDKQDGNSELKLVSGVTDEDGNAITAEYLDRVKREIKYANQTTHGSMNIEDKGRIHQNLMGRAIMNFRQWMVEHYSRRFRKRHWDGILQAFREGYWTSAWNMYKKQHDLCESLEEKKHLEAFLRGILVVGDFTRDLFWFTSRAKVAWNTMEEDQKYNVKRALTEVRWFLGLLGASIALGAPSDHKKEFWMRFLQWEIERVLLDEKTSIPGPWMLGSFLQIAQSPMASVNTLQGLLYIITGLLAGHEFETIKSGPNKGQNKYVRNVLRNVFPFVKHYQQYVTFGENNGLFRPFETSPADY